MAERFHAEISIPIAYITPDVEEAIDFEGAPDSYKKDGILYISDPEARYGEFEDLEKFLISRKIPFDRDSEAYTEYSAEAVTYRPDTGLVKFLVTSVDRNPFIETKYLKELLKLKEDEAFESLKQLLAEHDPQIAPLSDFTTKGGTSDEPTNISIASE